MSTAELLRHLQAESDSSSEFGQYEEEAIVSLALDFPEFFQAVGRFLRPEMFSRPEARYVVAHILNIIEDHSIVPTRPLLRGILERQLTVDDPYEEVLRIVDRQSNPREIPLLKKSLIEWTRKRAFGLLYEEEAQEAFKRGDYSSIEEIVRSANRITDVSGKGFWLLKQYEQLFRPEAIEHRTTGFPKLDHLLNNGGPSPGEVVVFLAATGVGKSLVLCNCAIKSLAGIGRDGVVGQNVLLVTFELDAIKTAMRCLGAYTDIALIDIPKHQDHIRRQLVGLQSFKKDLVIHELPPDECSVTHVGAIIDHLRRCHSWSPDVLVLDYLELMTSRQKEYNRDEYLRQKHVATEVRGLARNEGLLIFSATQTNRSGSDPNGPDIKVDQMAESYGKAMPTDYVVSLNQSESERDAEPPRIRFYVAKNRNGPTGETVSCTINYNSMQVRELL